MGRKPEMCEYGTEPLIVQTEDGARWINVDDVEEIECLLKARMSFLDIATVQIKRSKMETKSFDDLNYISPVECKRADETTCVNKDKSYLARPGEAGDIPDTAKVSRVVSSIIDRLRDLQQNLLELRPSHSEIYKEYAIHNEDKPPVVQAIDGSRWFNVADVEEVERIVEDDSGKSDSSATEVCVAITKLQIVAERVSKCPATKQSKKLKDKIVCVEYDVLTKDTVEPVKTVRAYLLIKSNTGLKNSIEYDTEFIPINAKNDAESMMRLTANEIEMIDAEIRDKRGYLDELRNVLKTKPIIELPNNKIAVTQANLSEAEIYPKLKRKSKVLSINYPHTVKEFVPKSGLTTDISKNTSATKRDLYKTKSLIDKNRPKSPNKKRCESTVAKDLNNTKKANGKDIVKGKFQRDTFTSDGFLNKLKHKQMETSITYNYNYKNQPPCTDLDFKYKKDQVNLKNLNTNSMSSDLQNAKQFMHTSTNCLRDKILLRYKSSVTNVLHEKIKNLCTDLDTFNSHLGADNITCAVKSTPSETRASRKSVLNTTEYLRGGKDMYQQFKMDLKELDSLNEHMDKFFIGAF